MNTRKIVRISSAVLGLSCLLALPACEDWDMTPKSDFAEKTMQKHYQNGEMNDYQYQTNVKFFQRPSQTAAASATGATGTAAPADTSGTAKPAVSP